MEFRRFEPTIFQFLEELSDNNNRPWFLENKPRYEREVLEPSLAFIRAFAPRLKKISPFFTADDRRVGGAARSYGGSHCKSSALGVRRTEASTRRHVVDVVHNE